MIITPPAKCKLIISTILLILSVLLYPHHANAGRAVRAGIYNFKPMVYSDKDGSAQGLFVKILNHIGQKNNWDVQYVPGTWQEGMDRLKNNQIDLLLCIGYTEERDKYLDFSKEFLVMDWGLVYKAKGSSINSIMDLKGKSVSVLKGSVYPTGFKELTKNFQINVTIKEMDQASDVLASVASGSADAGVASNLSGILNETWQRVERTSILFTPVKLGYGVNGGMNADLLDTLDREIAALKADKASIYYHELEHMLGKKDQEIPKEVYQVLFGVVTALLLAIAFIVILRRQVKAKTDHLTIEIEQRQLKEAALEESERWFRSFVENANDVLFTLSPTGVFSYISPQWQEFTGYELSETIGQSFLPFIHADDSASCLEFLQKVMESGERLSGIEFRVLIKDGSYLWYTVNASCVVDLVTGTKTLVGIGRDINERKRMEDALNKRIVALTQPLESDTVAFNELFNIDALQRLQDEFAIATGVASLILSPDGVPLTAPSNFTRLCNDLIRTSAKGCANCRTSDIAIGRNNPEGPIIQPCLSGGLWDAGAAIVVNGQHIASWLIGQVRDETQSEDKMAAYAREIGVDEVTFLEAFREVPSMTREKFEQISRALFTLATQLSTTAYHNIQQARFITDRKKAEEALWNEKAFLRSLIDSAADLIYFKDIHSVYLGCNKASEAFTGLSEQEQIGKSDFDLFDRELAEQIVTNDKEVLKGGVAVHLEESIIATNGKRILLDTVKTPIIGQDGQPIGLVGFSRDITERNKAEQQLQQAQKLESIGSLAGGVAHDFNNLLTVIMGHVQLGMMKMDANHPVCGHLTEIMKTAERSADLTRQLLAFARKQAISPKIIDLNEVIDGVLKMLRRLIGENIQLAWLPAPDLWQIKADPSQIDQILANLCVNARDAIKGAGRISIETRNNTVDANYCEGNPEAVPGDYVHLSVSDDGSGMDKQTMARVFEPFFTTKGVGEGTGLGLATVYGIVKQNNGFINIYSEPGKGTTFTINLPRQREKSLKTLTEAKTVPLAKGQETILLVEDEPDILHVTAQLLGIQGYTLLAAGTPGEAVLLALEHVGEINLLITDVIMPEMNGKDLVNKLQSINPHLKCLYMSGYTADIIAQHGVLNEGVYFIQKPFSLPDLATKVRDVLDG